MIELVKWRRCLGALTAVLTVCGAAIAIPAGQVASAAASTTNLIVGLNLADIQTVNAEVAVQQGFFKRQHLNVTFVDLPPAQAIDALDDGAIQVGEADPVTMLRAYNSGNNLKMLSGGSRSNFLLAADNSLKCSTWKSAFPGPLSCLVGHTIGVPALGGLTQSIGEFLMGEAPGCTTGGAHCVQWVADNDVTSAIPMLAAGTVQAQASWSSASPLYRAHHSGVWTVANAQLAPTKKGSSGKLVPLNVTAVPIATASELNAAPKVYEGFCQAIVDANAWLQTPANLKRAGQITANWLGDGTPLATAAAELKLQLAANVAHINATQFRGTERIDPSVSSKPYKDVDWAPCDRTKAH